MFKQHMTTVQLTALTTAAAQASSSNFIVAGTCYRFNTWTGTGNRPRRLVLT